MASYLLANRSPSCCGAGEASGINNCFDEGAVKAYTADTRKWMRDNIKHYCIAYTTLAPIAVEWFEKHGWKKIGEFRNRRNTNNVVSVLALTEE